MPNFLNRNIALNLIATACLGLFLSDLQASETDIIHIKGGFNLVKISDAAVRSFDESNREISIPLKKVCEGQSCSFSGDGHLTRKIENEYLMARIEISAPSAPSNYKISVTIFDASQLHEHGSFVFSWQPGSAFQEIGTDQGEPFQRDTFKNRYLVNFTLKNISISKANGLESNLQDFYFAIENLGRNNKTLKVRKDFIAAAQNLAHEFNSLSKQQVSPAAAANLDQLAFEMASTYGYLHSTGFGLDDSTELSLFLPVEKLKGAAGQIEFNSRITPEKVAASEHKPSVNHGFSDNSLANGLAALASQPLMGDGTLTYAEFLKNCVVSLNSDQTISDSCF